MSDDNVSVARAAAHAMGVGAVGQENASPQHKLGETSPGIATRS